MKTAEDLFQESISHYKAFIVTASKLCDTIPTLPPEELLKQCDSLNNLRKQQQHADKFLIEMMVEIGSEVLLLPCISEYQNMLDKAREVCDEVALKVKATHSLLH